MKEELNYEEDIRIDEDSLDLEWLDQPALMLKYSRNAAEKKREVDLAKENLDIARADADSYIRKNPEKYKLEKVTEAAVSAAILKDEDYLEASKKYLDAKYESDMANAAVRAIDVRKDALENLVRLYGLDYFAGPRVPHNLHEMREAKAKRIDSKISEKMNALHRNK